MYLFDPRLGETKNMLRDCWQGNSSFSFVFSFAGRPI
jgi:hypothetical protein